MYITYDVMYDVTVWYHNYVISYPKNCDITCEIIGNKKIHHMWYHIHFSTSHHDITYDITGMISHNCIWYHMWHHMWDITCYITYDITTIMISHVISHPCLKPGRRRRRQIGLQSSSLQVLDVCPTPVTNVSRGKVGDDAWSPSPRSEPPARWARHHCCDSWSGTVRLHEITNHSANWSSQFPSTSLAG
jgi:hypothetical protein